MNIKEIKNYLLEQNRTINNLIDLIDEKPKSSRHIIYSDGSPTSHYGYYLKPKDKWYTDRTHEKEIDEPIAWTDMPDVPNEFVMGEVGEV